MVVQQSLTVVFICAGLELAGFCNEKSTPKATVQRDSFMFLY